MEERDRRSGSGGRAVDGLWTGRSCRNSMVRWTGGGRGGSAEIAWEEATWRIIPVSKWSVTPIHKPFSRFGRGITLHRELTNHGY